MEDRRTVEVEYLPLNEASVTYGIPRTTLFLNFKRGYIEGNMVDDRLRLRRDSLDRLMHEARRADGFGAPFGLKAIPAPRRTEGTLDLAQTAIGHEEARTPPALASEASPYLSDPHAQDRDGAQEVQELAARLDDLHLDIRRTRRENEALQFEIMRYRMALEDKERLLEQREAQTRAAANQMANELRTQLENEFRERRQLESELSQLTEESKRIRMQVDEAEQRAQCAAQEAEICRRDAMVLRQRLDMERRRTWWERLLTPPN